FGSQIGTSIPSLASGGRSDRSPWSTPFGDQLALTQLLSGLRMGQACANIDGIHRADEHCTRPTVAHRYSLRIAATVSRRAEVRRTRVATTPHSGQRPCPPPQPPASPSLRIPCVLHPVFSVFHSSGAHRIPGLCRRPLSAGRPGRTRARRRRAGWGACSCIVRVLSGRCPFSAPRQSRTLESVTGARDQAHTTAETTPFEPNSTRKD